MICWRKWTSLNEVGTAKRSILRISSVALVAALAFTGCGDDDSGSNTAGAADSATVTTTLQGDEATTAAFCDEAPDPAAEVAESYVGSAEHAADLQRLRDVSPDELVEDLDLIIAHFNDRVDPADPDSQLTENFPAVVNEATGRVVAFTEEHCGA